MKTVLLSIAVGLTALAASAQTRYYVDPSATGAGDGTSWADAFTSLDAAFTFHNASGSGYDTLWVAEGVYSPYVSAQTDKYDLNRTHNIYGGFVGTETSLSQRDLANHQTIITGDVLGNDNDNIAFDEPTRSDNLQSLLYIDPSVYYTTIDGVIFEGANSLAGQGQVVRFEQSGGAYAINMNNVVFRNNSMENGTMIYCHLGQNFTGAYINTYTNCKFTNNSAGNLLYTIRAKRHSVEYNMVNTLFAENQIMTSGGTLIRAEISGAYPNVYRNVRLINCTIVKNTSVSGTGTVCTVGEYTLINTPEYQEQGLWIHNTIEQDNDFSHFASLLRTHRSVKMDTLVVTNSYIEAELTDTIAYHYEEFGLNTTDQAGFVDVINSDYRLSTCSPALNIGDATNLADYLPTTDLDGNTREYGTIDLGAYELSSAPQPTVTQAPALMHISQTSISASGGSGFVWFRNGEIIPGAGGSVLSVPGPGVYQVQVEYGNGCTAMSGEYNTCNMGAINIDVQSDTLIATPGFAQYEWLRDDLVIDGANADTIVAPWNTNGDMKVIVTDSDGCKASAEVAYCSPATSALIFSQQTGLFVTSVPGEIYYAEDHGLEYGGEEYQWTFEGVEVPGADEYQYTFSPMTPGLYSCQVTYRSGCFVEVFYQLCPTLTVDINLMGNTLEATAGFDTYQWYLDGTELTGETNVTITPTAVGNYTVEVADGSCSETSSAYNYTMVGVQEAAQLSMAVYPNPYTNLVTLNLADNQGQSEITVLDMAGRVVFSSIETGTNLQLNLEQLSDGAYILMVRSENGKTAMSRLIKN